MALTLVLCFPEKGKIERNVKEGVREGDEGFQLQFYGWVKLIHLL